MLVAGLHDGCRLVAGSHDALLNIHPGHVDVPSCRPNFSNQVQHRNVPFTDIENIAVSIHILCVCLCATFILD